MSNQDPRRRRSTSSTSSDDDKPSIQHRRQHSNALTVHTAAAAEVSPTPSTSTLDIAASLHLASPLTAFHPPSTALRNFNFASPEAQRAQLPSSSLFSSRTSSYNNPEDEQQRAPFEIFSALLEHPDVLMYLTTKHLAPDELLGLYAISRDFHQHVNQYQTAYIKSACRAWASTAAPVPTSLLPAPVAKCLRAEPAKRDASEHEESAADLLPFNMFRGDCIYDPCTEKPSTRSSIDPDFRMRSWHRTIPGFRYLFHMAAETRDARNVLTILYREHGMRLPNGTLGAMLKLGFLMNVRRNAVRIGLVHNRDWLTDRDLWLAENLAMKLDLALTHPLAARAPLALNRRHADAPAHNWHAARATGRGLRQMMMAFPKGWRVVTKVLTRQSGFRTPDDLDRMYIEWKYRPSESIIHWGGDITSLNGVRIEDCGWLQVEWSDVGPGRRLVGLDEMVTRESIRRGLRLRKLLLEAAVNGFVNSVGREDLDGRVDTRRDWENGRIKPVWDVESFCPDKALEDDNTAH